MTMSSDHAFVGGFGAPASTLFVSPTWEGPGSGGRTCVDGPYGIGCGGAGNCAGSLPGGVGDFRIVAYGENGADFLRWEGACSGTVNPCTVHFDTPGTTKEAIAVFHARPSTLGPFQLQGAGASGTVRFSAPPVIGISGSPLTCRLVNGVPDPAYPDCRGVIQAGVGTFTVTATPDPGSVFVWWMLGGQDGTDPGDPLPRCAETSPSCTFTLTLGGGHIDGIVTFAPACWFSLQVQVGARAG